jgi:hypothetical protein
LLGKRSLAIVFIVVLLSPSLFILPCKADLVDPDWADSIDNYALNVDTRTSAEIVVCVFPSLYGHGITDGSGHEINNIIKLGVYVFNNMPLDVPYGEQTGIGKKGADNGVLILVALNEHKWRIEVGYGLEGDLTDIETNLIAQKYLVPMFQERNYGEGLYDTVVALGEKIPQSNQNNASTVRGYYFYESDNTPTPSPTPFWDWNVFGMPLWAIVIMAVLGVFVPVGIGGRTRGGGRSGGGGSTGQW